MLFPVKRIVSRDEYFFLKDYNNQQVLSVHVLRVFTCVFFLVDEKIQLRFLACSFEVICCPFNSVHGSKLC